MPMDRFNMYLESIEEIRGREMLLFLDVAAFPHVTQDGKNKIIKKFQKTQTQTRRNVTTKDLNSILGGIVNGR